ncbi:MAG: DUF2059 domain-containing protein [Parasphingopyxis sp.]|uniref:DUF2059 domain-containing protein n=1 Tax=Parasphingopyxis sp. TaxID=1920299 RepID=UPI003F9F4189
MNRALVILSMGMAAIGAPLAAQTPPAPPAAEAPDPDRVEEARELLDLVLPPERRETMMMQMIEPSMANVEQGLMESPQFMDAMREDPAMQQMFVELLQRQRVATRELMAASLPGLIDAMSRAYARRFTVRQLRDMQDFFESDTGQAYLAEAPAIMADPDVGAWQRNLTVQSMAMMESEIEALMAHVEHRAPGPATNRPVTSSNLDAMRGGGEPDAAGVDEQPAEQE